MSSKDAHLYGAPRPKKTSTREISSSSTLAFTSQLSSLISTSKSKDPCTSRSSVAGRQRPQKEDIFSKHNRNTKKRALADLEDNGHTKQKHSTSSEAVDDATWHRAKRKMEEKARLYAAMKRGDVEDLDERYAVDFDRKWAEAEGRGAAERDSSDGEDGNGSEEDELIEYVDEFGRSRKGTKADVVREERRKKGKEMGVDEPDRFTARPAAPKSVIYGDTIQSAAFNPDEPIAQQMAELAAKRDSSLTPPPETHFDARQEIRQKGQGFFQFSADEEMRRKQMENLEKDRQETERKRKENEERREKRRKEVEERRKIIEAKRGKAQADRFLDGLLGDMMASNAEEGGLQKVEASDRGEQLTSDSGKSLVERLNRLNDGD